MKLKNKISAAVVALFVVAITTLVAVSFFSTSGILKRTLQNGQIDLATDTATSIYTWMQAKRSIIQAGANDFSKHPEQPKEYLTNQIKILNEAGGFTTVYPGYESGLFISSDGWIPAAGWDHRKRPWYELAKTSSKTTQTEPYVDAQTGKTVISFVSPITTNGKFAGVLSSDIILDDVVKQVLGIKVGKTGYAFIIDKDGKILIHPNKDLVLKKKFQEVVGGLSDLPAKLAATPTGHLEYIFENQEKLLSYTLIPASNWYICVTVDKAEVFSPVKKQMLSLIGLGILFLAVGIVLLLVFLTKLLKPLGMLYERVADIADGEGDLTKRVNVGERNDEIGMLAEKLNRFIETMRGIIIQISQTTNQVTSASAKLHVTADQMAAGADQVSCQANTIATAGEEMSATSSDIAHNCQLAADGSRHASAAAVSGAKVVDETIAVMNSISERVRNSAKAVENLGSRSDQIGEIVGTIEDIADQTNLLALNAAIEAARAGEQGRGFAVVADEVRALAERTTRATREIGEMIKTIQQETKGAVIAMEQGVSEVAKGSEKAADSGHALAQILQQINDVTTQIHQVATAAEEQTATNSEISNNMHQITNVVANTSRGAQETASAANQLSSLADELQQIVGKFKL